VTDAQQALVDRLFEEASALPPVDRGDFLARHCDDPDVLREVQSLLQYSRAGGVLSRPLAAVAEVALSMELPTEGCIGPYRILAAVGKGGMGTVYKAVREDEFRMTVAVKMLHFEASAEADQRRFRQERQILAELQHPNIARLIDGGATAQNAPYIVMEYVEGSPLTDYCRQHRLPVVERLKLFRQICDAVQYAHQKLIVHRDIKPGNILVTTGGVPKLLDFGIAKLLAPDPITGAAETVTGLQRMTPDYASPEQVRGEAVSLATDVYALGAVLFELLTGERPHRLKNYDMAEILREVCVTEVRRPSLVGGAELRGDLDTIVLKAMQKEPARRYHSVDQFSEDVRRFLEGYPVRARPDTIRYRARKFVRRNRFSMAAAAAVTVTLIGGIVASQYQARRAEEEFQQARRLARIALFDISRGLNKLPGARQLRDVVVRTSLEYLDRLTPRARRDPELRYEIAEGYMQIGELQHSHDFSNSGDVWGALRSWHRALDLLGKEVPGSRESAEIVKLRSDTWISIGEAEMSLGDSEKARQAFSQAEAPAKALIDMRPEAAMSYSSLYSIYNLEGDNEKRVGNPARALPYYKLASDTGEAGSRKTGAKGNEVRLFINIRFADAYRDLGRLPEALDQYQRALGFAMALARERPGDYTEQLYPAILQGLLGALYFGPVLTLHDRPHALEQFHLAYEGLDRLRRIDPTDAQVRDFFILTAAHYVFALAGTRPREALEIARRVAEAARDVPSGSGLIDFEVERVAASLALARASAAHGHHDAALASFAEAARIYGEARGRAPHHPDLAEQGILALLEWGDEEAPHNPQGGRAHHAEAFRLAAAYRQAHPGNVFMAALSEMARERLARGA
jgi:serine/threonine protein kinase